MSGVLPIAGTAHMVSPEARKLILNLPADEQYMKIKQNLPVENEREFQGRKLLLLPLHEDTSRILFNLGINTKGLGPLNYFYTPPLIEGEHPPMSHQIESAAFLATHPRAYNLSTMRTGKTGSEILTLDYILDIKGIEGAALIVAPLSTLGTVWKKSFNTTLKSHKVEVLHGGTGKKSRLDKLKKPADFFVINPDGLKLLEDELTRAVFSGKITKVIFDEMTIFGNPSSGRWKAANNIVNGKMPCKYVHGLTGTPGGDPRAVFGMAKLVNFSALPCDRLSTWMDMCYYRWGTQVWQIKERPEAQFLIQKVLQPAIRFDKKDIMDLPPVVTQGREAELSSEQQKFCSMIIKEMVASTSNGKVIEAANKASAIGKYFQAAQGAVIADTGIISVDDKPRVETILEIIKEATAKVVIFSCYTGVNNKLVDSLRAKQLSVEKVDGSVTGKKRDMIFNAFQNEENPKILVAHPETVAFGVELAAADMIIFNGPPRVGTFKVSQALERLSSMKQKAKQITIINLSATEEERISFNDIDRGIGLSESVNKLFTDMTKYGKDKNP